MDTQYLILLIIGMALVTAPPRFLPMVCLKADKMPKALLDWLSFVPVGVLAALLGPELLLEGGQFRPLASNIYLWAAIPALAVAWKTKSLFGTILIGMAGVAGARYLGY